MRRGKLMAGLGVAVTLSSVVCVDSQARPDAAPSQAKIVRCLRAAGLTTQALDADGAKLVVATTHGITWTISLAPPKPRAGWTASKKSPTARQKAIVNRCLT